MRRIRLDKLTGSGGRCTAALDARRFEQETEDVSKSGAEGVLWWHFEDTKLAFFPHNSVCLLTGLENCVSFCSMMVQKTEEK